MPCPTRCRRIGPIEPRTCCHLVAEGGTVAGVGVKVRRMVMLLALPLAEAVPEAGSSSADIPIGVRWGRR